MSYPSIRIEGNILSPDILERLEDAPGQPMLSTLAYSPCEPYGKRVKWRSLSH